jgi:hypothetical protein
MTDEMQDRPAKEDWENEGGPAEREPTEKTKTRHEGRPPSREEFFENLEQVSRPDDKSNGEKASKSEPGSNPDPSI